MNLSSVTSNSASAMDVSATTERTQQALQIRMLKKSLEMQQEQAAEVLKLIEGKGKVIDISA